MKVLRAAAIVLMAALVLVSCQSMAQGAVSGALGAVTGGLGGGGGGGAGGAVTAGAAPAAAEFQSGEVLCSDAENTMMDQWFYLARVLTPASAATKNQSEVVYVRDGKKEWANFVVNSRKATKADMVIGAPVFVCHNWDKIDADDYRKSGWVLKNITSIDTLYKGRVEVGGESFVVDYIRVPTDPVK